MKFSITNNALLPASTDATKFLIDHRIGEPVHVRALTDAQRKFRNYVFMVIGRVARAAGTSEPELRARLQIDGGHFTLVRLADKREVHVVKSMNMLSMGDQELQDFWEDASEIIVGMLPTFDEYARAEIEEMLKGPRNVAE